MDSQEEWYIHPSYYHGGKWRSGVSEILKKPISDVYLGNEGKNGSFLPLHECRSVRMRSLVSVPFRDRGGFAIKERGSDDVRKLLKATKSLAERKGIRRVVLNERSVDFEEELLAEGFVKARRGIEHILRFKNSDSEDLGVKGALKRNLAKAKREGIVAKRAREKESWEEFWRLLLASRRRMGVPSYPKQFLYHLLSDKESCDLYVTGDERTEVMAGVVVYYDRSSAYLGFAASNPRYLEKRVADSAYHCALKSAKERGVRKFCFGTDSYSQSTLHRFKRKWGAEPCESVQWIWDSRKMMRGTPDTETRKFAFVRNIFKRAPLGAYMMMSAISLKYWE